MKPLACKQYMSVNFLLWQIIYKTEKVYLSIVLEDTVYHQADSLALDL